MFYMDEDALFYFMRITITKMHIIQETKIVCIAVYVASFGNVDNIQIIVTSVNRLIFGLLLLIKNGKL